jgi:hypothetical protein
VDPALVKKYGNVIPDIYIASDKIIGEIIRLFKQQYQQVDIIIVSDHGFQTCHDGKYRASAKISYILNKMGMLDRCTYTKIGHSAIITLTDQAADSENRALLQLKDKLDQVTTIHEKIPIFESEFIDNYLKVSAQPRWKGYKFEDQIHFEGETVRVDDVLDKGVLITGMHEEEGIIIMSGEDIKKGHSITGAEVYDVTPTILALNRWPIARDMDGTVLNDVFTDEFLQSSSIEYVDQYDAPEAIVFDEAEMKSVKENEEALISQLRNLGYMD